MPKKFEDWTPPWTTKGEDFNAETAAKHIYNLEIDKETLGAAKATVTQERDAAVTRATTAETALAAKAQEGETAEQKAQRLEQEIAELKARPAAGAVTPEVKQTRLIAAMSVEGISAADALVLAEFIQGSTKEEAETSAKTFVEKFGVPGQTKQAGEGENDGEGGDEDEDNPLHSRPRGQVNNPLDSRQQSGGEKSVDDLLSLIPR